MTIDEEIAFHGWCLQRYRVDVNCAPAWIVNDLRVLWLKDKAWNEKVLARLTKGNER